MRWVEIIQTLEPHICNLQIFFIRYAENGDLMDFIVQFGAVSEMQTRFWARQISLAIQYLHTLSTYTQLWGRVLSYTSS